MTTPQFTPPSRPRRPHVIVIGDGVIGLATALGLARTGRSVRLLGRTEHGAASAASAGLLAPSMGSAPADLRAILELARDRYPGFVRVLGERTGIDVPLDRSGILEVVGGVRDDRGEGELATNAALAIGLTVRRHRDDGWVDTRALLAALREALRCEWSAEIVGARGARVETYDDHVAVTTERQERHEAEHVVIAAGAWSPLVAGVPSALPIVPVRGQMLALAPVDLPSAVAGADIYVVPRPDVTLVGSTHEHVGFNAHTVPSSLDDLRRRAAAIIPALAGAAQRDAWAGLRPMTPDGWPVIDRDPLAPRVIHASGHGRNGILLAPLTAELVLALIADSAPPCDPEIFRLQRFSSPA